MTSLLDGIMNKVFSFAVFDSLGTDVHKQDLSLSPVFFILDLDFLRTLLLHAPAN